MNKPAIKHALNVKRADDFAQWYQAVISEAELAEESGVRGCMVIKPWGYGIWERIQKLMDALDDHDDVQNVYANFDLSAEVLAELEKIQGISKVHCVAV